MEHGFVLVDGVEKQIPPSIKIKMKSVFNLMLDYAVEYEMIDKNWARTFEIPSEMTKEQQSSRKGHIPFDDKEIKALWDNLYSIPYIDVLLIQCYSGWRPQELGLIELENVDIDKWTFTGGMKTENGKNRVVPIHTKIRPLVQKLYDESKTNNKKFLITDSDNNNSKSLSYNQYRYRFLYICKQLNLNSSHRAHDGRMHFVTSSKKYGVDEYAIKYIVGHAVNDITESVYTKRELDWLRSEIEKIK